jgi:hypothetical protein
MSITLTRQQTEAMLKKIGANVENGAKHMKARLTVKGKHIFLIPISNGSKDIPTGTAQKIFRQTGLQNRDDYERLRNCPMTREEYLKIISELGIL